MKRLNINISDETAQKLEYLKTKRGMTYSGSVMVAISMLIDGDSHYEDSIDEVSESQKEKMVEIEKEMEEYKAGKGLCPVCSGLPDRCGHLADGSILRRLREYHGVFKADE